MRPPRHRRDVVRVCYGRTDVLIKCTHGYYFLTTPTCAARMVRPFIVKPVFTTWPTVPASFSSSGYSKKASCSPGSGGVTDRAKLFHALRAEGLDQLASCQLDALDQRFQRRVVALCGL